jgi:hypothetical protein
MKRIRSTILAPLLMQRGQGMIEYLMITAVVALVMFVATPLTDNIPPADYLALAVRSFFRGYSYLISVS